MQQTQRRFVMPPITDFVKKLVIGLLAAYVLLLVLDRWLGMAVTPMLAMEPAGPRLWQLVTFIVVELEQPLWFLFGLVILWWVLSPLEASMGPRRVAQLCVVSTLAGSLPAYFFGFVVPGSPALFGSSVLWFGGIGALTWINRGRPMHFIGLPAMTANQTLLLWGGLSFLMFLFSKNHTHFIASLGAMGGGVGFIEWLKRPTKPKKSPRVRRRSNHGLKVLDGGLDDDEPPKYLN